MNRLVMFVGWSALLLSVYGWSAIYGYSPFGDGRAVGPATGYRSGPVHK